MTYLAAILIVAAVALFVAAPLTEGLRRRRRSVLDDAERERFEHDRALAMQGLRELEFDHEMHKLDSADYQSLRVTLENRALAAMTALDHARPAPRGSSTAAGAPRAVPVSITAATPRGANFCPACGARGVAAAGHGFCPECGASLAASTRADAQAK
jgi:cytochrome c-type biogenesis protein CcmI